MNLRSWDMAVSLQGHGSNGLVYIATNYGIVPNGAKIGGIHVLCWTLHTNEWDSFAHLQGHLCCVKLCRLDLQRCKHTISCFRMCYEKNLWEQNPIFSPWLIKYGGLLFSNSVPLLHLAFIWPLNMYLLQNIQEELSEISFIHVPGTQLYWQKSLNVFEAREHA